MIILSIIVPVTRQISYIKRLVTSLESQEFDSNIFELVLIGDIESQRISESLNCTIVTRKKLGANAARNLGVLVSRGDLLFFIDDDCELRDLQLLKMWFDFFEKNPEISVAGGVYGVESQRYLDSAYNWIVRVWQHGGLCELPHLVGGHLLARRGVFDRVQWDASIDYGGTETEFCCRVRDNDLKLMLCPQFEIRHSPNLSVSSFLKKSYRQGLGKRHHNTRIALNKHLSLIIYAMKRPQYIPPMMAFYAVSIAVDLLPGVVKR